MLKASGIWVSPAEVEARLLAHDAVAQAVVVAAVDTDGLEKPVAYVQLHPGRTAHEVTELVEFCRAGLASFKRPRKVIFVDRLPDHGHRQDPPGGAARPGRRDPASRPGQGAAVTGLGRIAAAGGSLT